MLNKKIRLDKYLVHIGYGSRSEVQKLIKQKKVTVDGQVIHKPEFNFEIGLNVLVRGEPAIYKEFYYFILNKPAGYITATEDLNQETVIDLLTQIDRNKVLAPVGRLDKDTEGLLILTNDGQLNHNLLSPKKHVDKVYYAQINGVITDEDIKAFEKGITLQDGTAYRPAGLEIITSGTVSEVYVTISEGKFHQVKRMVLAVGKEVTYLKRIKMGDLMLPQDLEIGEYRELTALELSCLKGES